MIKMIEGGVCAAQGFRAAGIHVGVKTHAAWKKDVALIVSDVDCAAAADLTIALYNPASHGRPDHLKRACDILLRRLPGERLCGIVRNIGREGQSSRILTLAELREAEVDMFCTVLIGSTVVKTVAGQLVTPRGYRNV